MLAPALGDTFWRLGREEVARARALATVLTLLSICSRRDPKRRLELGEEVDEDKERRGADWQGTKQPSQLALTPIMNTIRAGVTPCYPDEGGFSPSIGKSLWTFKTACFGHIYPRPTKVAHTCWCGVRGIKNG